MNSSRNNSLGLFLVAACALLCASGCRDTLLLDSESAQLESIIDNRQNPAVSINLATAKLSNTAAAFDTLQGSAVFNMSAVTTVQSSMDVLDTSAYAAPCDEERVKNIEVWQLRTAPFTLSAVTWPTAYVVAGCGGDDILLVSDSANEDETATQLCDRTLCARFR